MIDNKYFLRCQNGHEYEVLLGVLGNFTCRVCGTAMVTIGSQVVTKETKENKVPKTRISKNVGIQGD
jgi:hypothetical protein